MPKTKKRTTSSSSSDSGPEDRNVPPVKKSKASTDKTGSGSSDKDTNSSENPSGPWTIEKLRQVRINEFKGRKMVDIREFYEKNGEILPGKKGISLHPHQWKKLLELAPEVNKALGD
ncbi:PREDICTED: RNA polymerase II transcriptional coactivator [Bactrocera latifrons]|uniref:RNA polymerase II transcriptional coactivator n=1 Tax=Bactrocera latifrons TaxID=174628 RepID=A0A0K8UB16_BACLA|nr:PREDICTED: RNA polymerase II transcriptional coactivator [Bactrocera latifrons]